MTNAEVLRQANEIPLQSILLQQQLLYYGRIVRNANHPGQQILYEVPPKRRRGRPVLSWNEEVRKHIGRIEADANCIYEPKQWRKVVTSYCFGLNP